MAVFVEARKQEKQPSFGKLSLLITSLNCLALIMTMHLLLPRHRGVALDPAIKSVYAIYFLLKILCDEKIISHPIKGNEIEW